jgi:transcriptional antiterminator RfaH
MGLCLSSSLKRNVEEEQKFIRDTVLSGTRASLKEDFSWVCLFTQPHRERSAKASLSEAGFDVFLPLCVKLVMRRQKYVQTLQPLFPRYIFARSEADMIGAQRMNGVAGFAGPSMDSSMVDAAIISAIKQRTDERGVLVIGSDDIKSGQIVQVLNGPFAGLQAIFSETDDLKRSFILLDLMGKSHRVRVLNTSIQVSA